VAEETYVHNIGLPVCVKALEICLGLGEGHLFAGTDGYSIRTKNASFRAICSLNKTDLDYLLAAVA
jgi:hypothetical protein